MTDDMARPEHSAYPACLLASPTTFGPATSADRARSMNAWVQNHNRAVIAFTKENVGAMHDGLSRNERGILSMLAGLDALASAGTAAREPFGVDHVWSSLLDGAREVLNFDLGRLDGGTLDAFICELSRRIGRSPVTGEYVPADDDA